MPDSGSIHGIGAICIGRPTESTIYGCAANPETPARTAAAEAQASRPIAVAAPIPAITMPGSEEVKKILHRFVRAFVRSGPAPPDSCRVELVHLGVAFERAVPH